MRGFSVGSRNILAFAILLVLMALPFLPGLKGPFLLDDLPNFEPLVRWAAGEIGMQSALTALPAGPLGRPVSLMSFMLNLAISGPSPLAFKATSLAIHLATSLALALLLGRMLELAGQKTSEARNWSWALALIWAVLPLHVPTVLYSVQRMTLLSGLFTVLALLTYLHARARAERNPSGFSYLFFAVPAFALLAALSKENGVLALPLCLVLELTLFNRSPETRAPHAVAWFFRLIVIWPALAALAYLSTHPGVAIDGYIERTFTLQERLLTQPRVLWSYAWNTAFPDPGFISLYQDAVIPSKTLFDPASTWVAIVAWITLGIAAMIGRHRYPLGAAGVAFFLVGHSMEGSIFPLDLFFTHRNYVPSIGLLMVAASLAATLARWEPIATRYRWSLSALFALAFLHFALATAGYAATWGNKALLYASELKAHPDSLRLRADLAAEAMMAGRPDVAEQHLEIARSIARPGQRRAVLLWLAMAQCRSRHQPQPGLVDELRGESFGRITSTEARAISQLADDLQNGSCKAPVSLEIAKVIETWLAATPQLIGDHRVWQAHHDAARMFGSGGNLRKAQTHALLAFENSGWQAPVGVLAFQLSASLNDTERCKEIYAKLAILPPEPDPRHLAALESFRKYLGRQNDARRKLP